MSRSSLVALVVVVVLIVAGLVALSRIDASKAPQRVEKPVPENALAK